MSRICSIWPTPRYSLLLRMLYEVRIVSRFFLKSELCQWVPHSQIFRVNISKSVSGDTIHTRRQEGERLRERERPQTIKIQNTFFDVATRPTSGRPGCLSFSLLNLSVSVNNVLRKRTLCYNSSATSQGCTRTKICIVMVGKMMEPNHIVG